MVKKLGILGIILIAVAAAGMVWAETTNMGVIAAPQPMLMPAAAPPACIGGSCAPPPPKVMPMKPKKLTTSIEVKLQYPQPAAPVCPPPMCGPAGPPPMPVAVPMWKFIVPWPPFVYYLPVE
jgi:hypothetical protein